MVVLSRIRGRTIEMRQKIHKDVYTADLFCMGPSDPKVWDVLKDFRRQVKPWKYGRGAEIGQSAPMPCAEAGESGGALMLWYGQDFYSIGRAGDGGGQLRLRARKAYSTHDEDIFVEVGTVDPIIEVSDTFAEP